MNTLHRPLFWPQRFIFRLGLVGLVALTVSGCGGKPAHGPADKSETKSPTEHDAQHTDPDQTTTQLTANDEALTTDTEEPAAAPEKKQLGPHGGVLAVWESRWIEFEVVIDHQQASMAVYTRSLNSRQPIPLPIKQLEATILVPNMKITLLPKRLAGEPPDSSSMFVGSHPSLATDLKISGTISGKVERDEFEVTFYELPDAIGDF